jgi:hypothetical protein
VFVYVLVRGQIAEGVAEGTDILVVGEKAGEALKQAVGRRHSGAAKPTSRELVISCISSTSTIQRQTYRVPFLTNNTPRTQAALGTSVWEYEDLLEAFEADVSRFNQVCNAIISAIVEASRSLVS